jgi:hypothetical protein
MMVPSKKYASSEASESEGNAKTNLPMFEVSQARCKYKSDLVFVMPTHVSAVFDLVLEYSCVLEQSMLLVDEDAGFYQYRAYPWVEYSKD